MASLISGIDWGFGFQALIAQPGMGKTSLLLDLLHRFHTTAHTAFLFQPQVSPVELMQSLLSELGANSQATSIRNLCEELNLFLVDAAKANKRVVIILDEAQNLDFTSLEMLRQLSNFETSTSKLMNVVLAGQPQLLKKLSSPEQQQLQQRISAIGRLSPLSLEDTSLYIEHRLKTAGYDGPGLFPAGVIDDIWQNSQGIPRNINRLCLSAMLLAFTERTQQVSNSIIKEAICDLDPSYIFSQMREGAQNANAVETTSLRLPETPARTDAASSQISQIEKNLHHVAEASISADKTAKPVVRAVEITATPINLTLASKNKTVQRMEGITQDSPRTRAVKPPPVRPNTARAPSRNQSRTLTFAATGPKPRGYGRIWFNALMTMAIMGTFLWFVIERAASNSWPQQQRTGPVESSSSSLAVSGSDPKGGQVPVKPASIATLYFDEDSTTIDSESRGSLAEVVDMLGKNPRLDLVLEGHTDNFGPEAYNQDLSSRRSLAVRDMLSNELHVPAERLSVSALGSAQPLQSNATATGRAYNRRVEIRVVEHKTEN